MAEPQTLLAAHKEMSEIADALAGEKVVPLLVNPLAQAIASRS
jgi:hypothetical protein